MKIIRGCEMDFVLQRIRISFFIRFGLFERYCVRYFLGVASRWPQKNNVV